MKILHVTQFLTAGGLEQQVFHLAKAQIAKGDEVTVFCYEPIDQWSERFEKNGIRVISHKKRSKGFDSSTVKNLSLVASEYEIIHTHDLSPLFYLFFAMFLKPKLFTKRILHTVHGLSQLQQNFKYFIYIFFLLFIPKKVIFVSKDDLDFYRKVYFPFGFKYLFIPNGIDTQLIQGLLDRKESIRNQIRQKLQIPSDQKICIVVARIVPEKNIDLLCKLWRSDFPLLLFVGPIVGKQYFDQLDKKENMIFLGPKSNVFDYLLASDLFISLSKTEGMPLSVMEAMCIGLPCLLSEIPGHQKFKEINKYTYTPFDLDAANSEMLEQSLEIAPKIPGTRALSNKSLKIFSIELCEQRYRQLF